ncbi:SEC-C metal-binding domain-containing protein [Streptomyces hirsutus]
MVPQRAPGAHGRALPWPPRRSATCRCGSGRTYGECHGTTAARRGT